HITTYVSINDITKIMCYDNKIEAFHTYTSRLTSILNSVNSQIGSGLSILCIATFFDICNIFKLTNNFLVRFIERLPCGCIIKLIFQEVAVFNYFRRQITSCSNYSGINIFCHNTLQLIFYSNLFRVKVFPSKTPYEKFLIQSPNKIILDDPFSSTLAI